MFATCKSSPILRLVGTRLKHCLPAMPFEYHALEPVISRQIMEIHHTKHHQTYITNLNAAEQDLACAVQKGDVEKVIKLAPALRFNGGGHINHSIFWKTLSPSGGQPTGELQKAIENEFGTIDNMKNQLAAASIGVQGSGWGWLGFNKGTKRLQIATCANQDPLEPTTGLVPLFGIDVWEHAYYLQYKNVRADYVKAIFDVANWKYISELYEHAYRSTFVTCPPK